MIPVWVEPEEEVRFAAVPIRRRRRLVFTASVVAVTCAAVAAVAVTLGRQPTRCDPSRRANRVTLAVEPPDDRELHPDPGRDQELGGPASVLTLKKTLGPDDGFPELCFDSRAAKEFWKFCNSADAVFTAAVIGERAPTDWWERGAPKRR